MSSRLASCSQCAVAVDDVGDDRAQRRVDLVLHGNGVGLDDDIAREHRLRHVRCAFERARRPLATRRRHAPPGVSPRRRSLHEPLAQRRGLVRHRREQQLVLRRVVPVQRSERDLGTGGDVAHLHRVVTAFSRQCDRGRDEPLLAGSGLGGAGSRSWPASPADRSANLERVAGVTKRLPTIGVMRTQLARDLGLEFPIFAFSHCRDVVAAVSRAGGMGVLGALYFTPEELEIELKWIDEHVDGKPYGVDLVMPAKVQLPEGVNADELEGQLEEMITQEHRDWVEKVLAEHNVPPLPADRDGGASPARLDRRDRPPADRHRVPALARRCS